MEKLKIQCYFVLIVCLPIFLTGCDSSEKDWKNAKTLNSKTEYQNFINKHPSSDYAVNAKYAIDSFSWLSALSDHNVDRLEHFLLKKDSNLFLVNNKFALDSIEFKIAFSSGNCEKLKMFISDYPNSNNKLKAETYLNKIQLKDAMDWLIAFLSFGEELMQQQNAKSGLFYEFNGLSKDESNRLLSIRPVTIDSFASSMTSELDGSYNWIKGNGYLKAKLSGVFNYDIKIIKGEFGIKDDHIFFKEGTTAIINNQKYQHIGEGWKIIN